MCYFSVYSWLYVTIDLQIHLTNKDMFDFSICDFKGYRGY